jgi:hypothetical protein
MTCITPYILEYHGAPVRVLDGAVCLVPEEEADHFANSAEACELAYRSGLSPIFCRVRDVRDDQTFAVPRIP